MAYRHPKTNNSEVQYFSPSSHRVVKSPLNRRLPPLIILTALTAIAISSLIPVVNRPLSWVHPWIWDPQTGQYKDGCEPVRLLPEFECVPPDKWFFVSWKQVPGILSSGKVSSVFQAHDLTVLLSLRDGTMAVTKEPRIDEIGQEIATCGNPCNGISFTTE